MNGLLIAIVLFLTAISVAQIVRIFELSSALHKEDSNAVTPRDNDRQGKLLLIFGILFELSFFAMVYAWMPDTLPLPASLHGVEYDGLWDVSMWTIIFVFLLVQPILFYFSYKYRGIEGNKASFIEHNNKLEMIWTVVPALVLAVLIIYGMTTWSNTMNPKNDQQPIVIEVYAQQFKWTARYAGNDNTLAYANIHLIQGTNTLGVDTLDKNFADDKIAAEIHLPVGRPVLFKFRSQDVIHSAYMPHFRAQMNCVPGVPTQFQFTPTITTTDIRKDPKVMAQVDRINALRLSQGKEPYEYDYLILCNKICGAAHYNMQMPIVVESVEQYNQWLKEQKTVAETL